MKDFNVCILTGTITGNPLISKTSEGNPFALFQIVVHNTKPTTIKAACLGDLTNQIKPYLSKGNRLGLKGKLGESKNGIQLAVTNFIVLNAKSNQPVKQPKPNSQKEPQAKPKVAPQKSASLSSDTLPKKSTLSNSSTQSSTSAQSNTPRPSQSPQSSSASSITPKSAPKSSSNTNSPFDSGKAQMPRDSNSPSSSDSSASDDLPF